MKSRPTGSTASTWSLREGKQVRQAVGLSQPPPGCGTGSRPWWRPAVSRVEETGLAQNLQGRVLEETGPHRASTRDLQRAPPWAFSRWPSSTCMGGNQRGGETCQKGEARTTPSAHTGPEIAYIPTARVQTPLTLRVCRRVLIGYCLSRKS